MYKARISETDPRLFNLTSDLDHPASTAVVDAVSGI